MKRKRTKFQAAFKFKVVLEALKEQQTLSELAAKYDIHPNMISRWKSEFIERGSQIFDDSVKKKDVTEPDAESLYKAIGQMKVENDWLKKKLGPYL